MNGSVSRRCAKPPPRCAQVGDSAVYSGSVCLTIIHITTMLAKFAARVLSNRKGKTCEALVEQGKNKCNLYELVY